MLYLKEHGQLQGEVDEAFENCDQTDIALADFTTHREQYPRQWELRGQLNRLKRRRIEEEAAAKAEKFRQQQQLASAEARKRALDAKKEAEKKAASKNTGNSSDEDDKQEATLMQWHPYVILSRYIPFNRCRVLKELVAVPSSQRGYEDWRDH